ncbi:hypothetical protein JTB14_000793 [Gonioctena quinquepunctata]|nr:hypothetical protein JTB14_000793 [Gonioctena quinquepunctata]
MFDLNLLEIREITIPAVQPTYEDVYPEQQQQTANNKKIIIPEVKENDYVVVKLCGKKSTKYYVGLVQSALPSHELSVKFMKKCGQNKFIFPELEDISLVMSAEVIAVLDTPVLNNRHQYIFENIDAKYVF